MQRLSLSPWTRLVSLAVLLCALALAVAPGAFAANIWTVDDDFVDDTGCVSPTFQCKTIETAVGAASAGDTINVAAGTYVLSSVVNVNKDGITLDGAGAGTTIVQVSGTGDRFNISAAGVTLQDFEIVKTDKTGEQNIIRIGNSNITIKNNTIHGQFVIGDGEVSRAMVINAGAFSGLNIEGNTIYDLRQPAYISGLHTGTVQNNHTYRTKGWVLEGGDLTFTGNTWGTSADANVYDIAILATMPAAYYTDIVAMSNANNGAVVEDQRVSPAVLSVVYVDAATSYTTDLGGRYHPYSTIAPAITRVVAGGTVNVAAGTYVENVNINKTLNLRGATGGDFSSTVPIAPTQASGVWYPDRYAPAVFESYNLGGQMVLRHGVRIADSSANRPPAYNSTFYNTQGRKLDTNLTGPLQSMSIDVWLDASMAGADQRYFGLWATGFDSADGVSSYPIVAFRNVTGSPVGFYGWDYSGTGNWTLIKQATAADYGHWHTFTVEQIVGQGARYYLDGQLAMTLSDSDTVALKNVILNVYNYGQDYDVYWDNFKVGSATPTPYEPVVTGVMNITASAVEVTGLYLTNPGQTNAVIIGGATSNVTIANNRIQGVGSASLGSVVHSLLMNNGADQVQITNNAFTNLRALNKSLSAIGVLDSAATNSSEGLLIRSNTFSDIASVGATKGAYGVIINNKVGAPAAQILNNTFNGLSGGWTHAIGLEGPTPNALIQGNSFSGLTAAGADNIAVHFEDNPVAATVVVTGNQFNGGGYYGVAVNPDDMAGGANGLCYSVNAENNWWNSAEGPTGAGAVPAGPQVDYSPWWTDAAGTGTASSGSGSDVEFVIPAGASTATQNAIIACAANETVTYLGDPVAGGVVVNTPGVTINLNGFTVGAGSPAFTIVGDDVTLQNGILDGTGNTDGSAGVLVTDGADNFILQDTEIKNWAIGVEVAGSHESLKVVNNWMHLNTDAGLQVNTGAALTGIVTVQGNLFKANGVGITSAVTLNAEYNSWGTKAAPAAMPNVDADPWTFSELYFDVDPTVADDQYARNVNETNAFDVTLMAEAENLYGLGFKFTYDTGKLTLNTKTLQAPWAGACAELLPQPAGTVAYVCNLLSGPEWDGGAIATFNFTANAGPAGPGPWTALFDIAHLPADTNSGALGGIKVFVNNAGFDAPSTTDRNITDVDDGEITIDGLANYTGFVDLQGRANDSGAVFEVYNQAATSGATVYASGTTASSGKYTTAYVSLWQLVIGQTYYFQVDRALYLPTTAVAKYLPSEDLPTAWQHSKLLATRPLESVTTVVLLGGDATNDNVIDSGDAGCIGGAYGRLTPAACGTGGTSDVNEDGKMDILDLTLMGGNYTKTSSDPTLAWTP